MAARVEGQMIHVPAKAADELERLGGEGITRCGDDRLPRPSFYVQTKLCLTPLPRLQFADFLNFVSAPDKHRLTGNEHLSGRGARSISHEEAVLAFGARLSRRHAEIEADIKRLGIF